MLLRKRLGWLVAALCLVPVNWAAAREWTDASGKHKQQADLVDHDDRLAVLKKADGRLVAVPIEKLSKEDQQYLRSKSAEEDIAGEASKDRTWTLVNGTKVEGKVLRYGRKELDIERKNGKLQILGRPYDKLTKLHQHIVPLLVSEFEKATLKNEKDIEQLLIKRKNEPLKYTVEGVVLELDGGEQFAVPFSLLSEKDRGILKPGWDEWVAAANDAEKQKQSELFVRSLANDYQRERKQREQVQMLAAASDWYDMWEVTLQQGGQTQKLVVPGRDSNQAKAAALSKYPSASVGPIRKLQKRY